MHCQCLTLHLFSPTNKSFGYWAFLNIPLSSQGLLCVQGSSPVVLKGPYTVAGMDKVGLRQIPITSILPPTFLPNRIV